MADPATNTAYPAEVDLLPTIGPNDKQNEPGLEHDVQHDRANAILNALMVLIGTTEDTAAESMLGRVLALEQNGGGTGSTVAEVVEITTAAHGLGLPNAGRYNRTTFAGTAVVTMQPQSAVEWPPNVEIHVRAVGGALTVAAGAGVTVNPPAGGSLIIPQHGTATLKRVASNAWDLMGQTNPP